MMADWGLFPNPLKTSWNFRLGSIEGILRTGTDCRFCSPQGCKGCRGWQKYNTEPSLPHAASGNPAAFRHRYRLSRTLL